MKKLKWVKYGLKTSRKIVVGYDFNLMYYCIQDGHQFSIKHYRNKVGFALYNPLFIGWFKSEYRAKKVAQLIYNG